MYRLTNTDAVLRIEDGAMLPCDPSNRDYHQYLEWLDEGNEPEPAPPKTCVEAVAARELLITEAGSRIQQHEREVRNNMTPTCSLQDLDDYMQAIVEMNEQPEWPDAVVWPSKPWEV